MQIWLQRCTRFPTNSKSSPALNRRTRSSPHVPGSQSGPANISLEDSPITLEDSLDFMWRIGGGKEMGAVLFCGNQIGEFREKLGEARSEISRLGLVFGKEIEETSS